MFGSGQLKRSILGHIKNDGCCKIRDTSSPVLASIWPVISLSVTMVSGSLGSSVIVISGALYPLPFRSRGSSRVSRPTWPLVSPAASPGAMVILSIDRDVLSHPAIWCTILLSPDHEVFVMSTIRHRRTPSRSVLWVTGLTLHHDRHMSRLVVVFSIRLPPITRDRSSGLRTTITLAVSLGSL